MIMATVSDAGGPSGRRVSPLAPGLVDFLLAAGSLAMLAAVAAALARGVGDWGRLPPLVWLHIATICLALALTPVMLLRGRGDRRHRQLGYLWLGAMVATALASYGIRSGGFSLIHILSTITLLGCWRALVTARRHDWRNHRRTLRAIVGGALLLAGFFTFQFDRILGHWLLG